VLNALLGRTPLKEERSCRLLDSLLCSGGETLDLTFRSDDKVVFEILRAWGLPGPLKEFRSRKSEAASPNRRCSQADHATPRSRWSQARPRSP
jgi:hypothetical protein